MALDTPLMWHIFMAIGLGALIGLEREFDNLEKEDSASFGGIRTFPLIASAGVLAAFIGETAWAPFLGVMLLVIAGLLCLSYVISFRVAGGTGITTVVAAILVFLLGVIIQMGLHVESMAVAVAIMALLRMKGFLHGFSQSLEAADMEAILKFGVVTAIVLPVLPDAVYGPYSVFNPRHTWFMVVLISGIGFAGYAAMRLVGVRKGLPLTGLMGGLVSSTAVTLNFSRRAKTNPSLGMMLAVGVVIANLTMVPRVFIEVAVAGPILLSRITPVLGAMLLAGLLVLGLQYFFSMRDTKVEESSSLLEFTNPLRLKSAMAFGVMYAVVLFVARVAQEEFSEVGIYAVAIISGGPDVNAITLSLAGMAEQGVLATEVAWRAIILGCLSNSLFKIVLVMSLGSSPFRRFALMPIAAMLAVGAAGVALF